MKCQYPPPLSEETLSLVLDGLSDPQTDQHLLQCPSCKERLRDMQQLDASVQQRFRRFECPAPKELGDYHARMLDADKTETIRQHLYLCPLCQDDLNTLIAFLNLAPESPSPAIITPLYEPANVWRASPAQTSGNLALRGVEDKTAHDMKAGSASILMESKPAANGFLLTGQVLDTEVSWASAVAEAWQDGTLQQAHFLDDMGEFSFEFSTATPVDLYITAASGVTLVMEDIVLQT